VADDDFPITALIPSDDRAPVVIHSDAYALKMSIVERTLQRHLPSDWDTPGVYVLFDPVSRDGTATVYVGQSRSLRKRLQQHRTREQWSRALLIVRDTSYGFTTAEIGFLEGRLHAALSQRAGLRVGNAAPTGDETLPAHHLSQLEAALLPILSALRLLGAGGTPAPRRRPARRPEPSRPGRREGSVADLLAAGLLSAGDVLHSTGRKYHATATVAADGTITVNGARFRSLSAAGSHVRDGRATNGWDFWRTTSGQRLSALRERLKAAGGTTRQRRMP